MSQMPPPPPPPGGYMPPLPPPPMGGGATVRIGDWFNEAFDRIKPAWVDYFVAGLVAMIAIAISALLCYIPYFIVGGPLVAGVYIFVAKKMLGLPAEIGDIFKGFRKFSETLLLWLVLVLPPVVVYIIAWLPAMLARMGMGRFGGVFSSIAGCIGCIGIPVFGIIYPVVVGTLFIFAFPLVLFKNMDAMGALKASMELVKPNFMNFMLLWLACILMFLVAEIAGLILCLVGILVTIPVAGCVLAMVQLEAYRDFYGLNPENLSQYN